MHRQTRCAPLHSVTITTITVGVTSLVLFHLDTWLHYGDVTRRRRWRRRRRR